jgi:hypothetical protein
MQRATELSCASPTMPWFLVPMQRFPSPGSALKQASDFQFPASRKLPQYTGLEISFDGPIGMILHG